MDLPPSVGSALRMPEPARSGDHVRRARTPWARPPRWLELSAGQASLTDSIRSTGRTARRAGAQAGLVVLACLSPGRSLRQGLRHDNSIRALPVQPGGRRVLQEDFRSRSAAPRALSKCRAEPGCRSGERRLNRRRLLLPQTPLELLQLLSYQRVEPPSKTHSATDILPPGPMMPQPSSTRVRVFW